jgi:hypothetical protein
MNHGFVSPHAVASVRPVCYLQRIICFPARKR